MSAKTKKEWRLRDILGFSKYIYAALLILALVAMGGMTIYGIIKNPSTFENVIIKAYDYNEIGLVSAIYEKDGQKSEKTMSEIMDILAPVLDKKVKKAEAPENGEILYKITFISDIVENNEKKSVPTLELTFMEGYCKTTDLHYGGGTVVRFK